MISFQQALQKIDSLATPFSIEHVGLLDALDRVLAENVYADRDYPPFNRAAMDGIGISSKQWHGGARSFQVRQTVFAGMRASCQLQEGECFRIMTGAACPPQVDLVIRNEDLEFTGDNQVRVLISDIRTGQHIAAQGEDLLQGSLALGAPVKLTPVEIALLAALGINSVPVYRQPSIAIVTTGSEVVSPQNEPLSFQIRNSNAYLLQALCKQWRLPVSYTAHVEDEKKQIAQVLEQAIACDLLIINGGVSAGMADFIPQVLAQMGVEILFHKVSIKPGKPLLIGQHKNGTVIFALPGNPLSCLTSFTLFVTRYLRSAYGLPPAYCHQGILKNRREKKTPFDEFFPVFKDTHTGEYNWKPHHGSGDITAALCINGLGLQPAHQMCMEAGQAITIFPLQ